MNYSSSRPNSQPSPIISGKSLNYLSPLPLAQAQALLVTGEGVGPAGPHRIRHAQIQLEDFLAVHGDQDEVLVPLHGPGVVVPFPVLAGAWKILEGLEVDPGLFKNTPT